MKWARRILFYLFVAIFVAACPVLILYSFGYIFSPVSQQVVRTGLVYLSSSPSDADIFFGSSHYKDKTPTSVTELMPGDYRITVRKNGYRPWTHKVSIEPGKAATFDSVILIPKTPKGTVVSSGGYDNMIPPPGTEFLILKSGPKLEDYLVFDLNKKITRPLIAPDPVFGGLPVVTVFTQPDSAKVLIYAGPFWSRDYLLVNAGKEELPEDATKLFPDRPDETKWHPYGRTKKNEEYDKENKSSLHWTAGEIFTAGPEPETQAIVMQKVYSGGWNIRQCFWVYKGSHILFTDRGWANLLELAPDGTYHTEPVVKIKGNSSVYYSDETGRLYFLDPEEGNLNELRILAF